MYCGTLAAFGYTEDSLPAELAPYLNYPLLILAGSYPLSLSSR